MVNRFIKSSWRQLLGYRWGSTGHLTAQFRPANRCLVCRRSASGRYTLCLVCHKLLYNQLLNMKKCCACCALPLSGCHNRDGIELLCGHCQKQRPLFERCLAAAQYSPIAARLVNDLKHHRQLAALRPMAESMLEMLKPHPTLALDRLVPVPLHKQRLAERGFNQSLEIARILGRQLDIQVDTRSCVRISSARAQQRLNRKERIRNLKNAFAFRYPLNGARIAIIDDVVTTTATANAMAEQAMRAGAVGVEIWCFARTPSPDWART